MSGSLGLGVLVQGSYLERTLAKVFFDPFERVNFVLPGGRPFRCNQSTSWIGTRTCRLVDQATPHSRNITVQAYLATYFSCTTSDAYTDILDQEQARCREMSTSSTFFHFSLWPSIAVCKRLLRPLCVLLAYGNKSRVLIFSQGSDYLGRTSTIILNAMLKTLFPLRSRPFQVIHRPYFRARISRSLLPLILISHVVPTSLPVSYLGTRIVPMLDQEYPTSLERSTSPFIPHSYGLRFHCGNLL